MNKSIDNKNINFENQSIGHIVIINFASSLCREKLRDNIEQWSQCYYYGAKFPRAIFL